MKRSLALLALFGVPIALAAQDDAKEPRIYVPTERKVVEKMLHMAKVTKDDIIYDLGCGDGRIVVTAAKRYGCKGVGIDIDPARIKDSLETRRKAGLTEKDVEFREGDALKVEDLEKATVITLYMIPEFMAKLEPQIKTRLKPGTRIVAHDYPFETIDADQIVQFDAGGSRAKFLYLWTIREPKKK